MKNRKKERKTKNVERKKKEMRKNLHILGKKGFSLEERSIKHKSK